MTESNCLIFGFNNAQPLLQSYLLNVEYYLPYIFLLNFGEWNGGAPKFALRLKLALTATHFILVFFYLKMIIMSSYDLLWLRYGCLSSQQQLSQN
ncbi:hypothetical protein EGR_00699 [Echinococcus granulosus]|uniref:Uncharacterized protein n=1 Tax=Echinococcus granulosus TaxID=6210 RepID=W6UR16_ECHGR|nr:hypothetical protein EGR_00699 [Echinococcus granulosus]EUB64155.1 hypothetical protein EGR_00699 [Echinococcus granulosus]